MAAAGCFPVRPRLHRLSIGEFLVLRAVGVRDARVIEVQGVSFESFAVPDSRDLS